MTSNHGQQETAIYLHSTLTLKHSSKEDAVISENRHLEPWGMLAAVPTCKTQEDI